jgi:ABC-type uncharacterized transport system ATPase subunit
MTNLAVEIVGVSKRFGPILANDKVSLAIPAGSVHAVMGENGAGKTTLMSMLAGLHRPDEGEIRLHGKPVRFAAPRDAIAAGIGMVHQHFMLVEELSVLDNLMLGREEGWRLAPGRRRTRAAIGRMAAEHGLAVEADARVADLPVGVRQRVEILKALHRGAEILILDEPTAVLTPQETEGLFAVVRKLREAGRTILIVTHKLREALALADSISVMRGGRLVATLPVAEATEAGLAELMIGARMAPPARAGRAAAGRAILGVEGLSVRDATDVERVKALDLVVRAGEIVGIAGVAGNGQSELLAALCGAAPAAAGKILLDGVDVTSLAPRERRERGLAHIPEDRLEHGLVREFSAAESLLLGASEGPVLLSRRALAETARASMAAWDVRPPGVERRTALFSGGNQQKLVCAREVERKPKLLLAGQPTRGVDIGAAALIHRRILAARDAGAAVLLISSELDELRLLADRLLVLFDGRIVGEADPERADDRALGLLMAGIRAAA